MAEEFRVEFSVACGDGVLRVSEFDNPIRRKFHLSSLKGLSFLLYKLGASARDDTLIGFF
jgi:hypothetical protein